MLKSSITTTLLIFTIMMTPITEVSSQAQIPILDEFDEAKYYGYEYGASGISNAMIEAVNLDILDSKSANMVLNSIETSLEQIWNERSQFEGNDFASWSKKVDSEFSSIYPGKKYGAPGIITTFLDFYELTNEQKWIDRAEESYWTLSAQASNKTDFPHWPYTYSLPGGEDGIAITDIKYGSAGILEVSLELFEITNNQNYLNHAQLIVSWLDYVSRIIIYDEVEYKVIPWYHIRDTESIVNLNYGWGIAGIAPLIYRFGQLTNSNELIDWALLLADFIQVTQNSDGSWTSEYQGSIKFTGFDEGVAGIVYGLNQMKILNQTTKYDKSIESGINWLFSLFSNDADNLGFSDSSQNDQKYTSLNRGLIGILNTLISLNNFISTDQLDKIISSYKWLLTKGSFLVEINGTSLMMVQQSLENVVFTDLSLSEGLAGLLLLLTNTFENSKIRSQLNVDITDGVLNLLNTLLYYQEVDGFWKRQIKIEPNWNITYLQTTESESILIINSFIVLTFLLAYSIHKKFRNL